MMGMRRANDKDCVSHFFRLNILGILLYLRFFHMSGLPSSRQDNLRKEIAGRLNANRKELMLYKLQEECTGLSIAATLYKNRVAASNRRMSISQVFYNCREKTPASGGMFSDAERTDLLIFM